MPTMPRVVSAARLLMMIQAAFGVLTLLAFFVFLGGVLGDPNSWPILLHLLFTTATTALLAVAVIKSASRRRRMRILAFVAEGLLFLFGVAAILTEGFSLGLVGALILPTVVLMLLALPTSAAWFDRS